DGDSYGAGVIGPRKGLGMAGVGTGTSEGCTIRGVTTISSSFLLLVSDLLWKSFPKTGTSPIHGILLNPSLNTISDSALSVVSAGIKKPWIVSAFEKSSALTSGLTFK